jgi:hypothetical protein
MKKAVIFDIDGVLAEKSPDRDYREYDKVDLDKPILQGFHLLDYYHFMGYSVLFITGRKEVCRENTIKFICNKPDCFSPIARSQVKEIGWLLFQLDLLINQGKGQSAVFMRGDKDHREATILKKEIYNNHIKGKYDVVAVFDDDPDICKMWKKEGLFVFQVTR